MPLLFFSFSSMMTMASRSYSEIFIEARGRTAEKAPTNGSSGSLLPPNGAQREGRSPILERN